MKHLKTFESFSVNETMDMMTMPVDPIAGAADVYKDITDAIGNKISDITKSLKEVALPEVSKIKDFMIKTFGTTTPELTEENAQKLYDVLGLSSVKENIENSFQEGENLVVKLCGRIKQVLGINMYAWGGVPLAIILGGLIGSNGAIAGILISSFALLYVFSKIMQLFGYGSEDTDVADIGAYNPQQDIRNK
jgi:hypothetical protein